MFKTPCYKIVTSPSLAELEVLINQHLQDGFKPLQGVAYTGHDYVQAVYYCPELEVKMLSKPIEIYVNPEDEVG